MEEKHNLDVSMNLSIIFLKNIGIWITDDPATKRRMKILLTYTVWNTLLAVITILRDLYFTLLYKGVSICGRYKYRITQQIMIMF